MRQIKFRVWDAEIKQMCQVLMIWPAPIIGVQWIRQNGNIVLSTTASKEGVEVMQFTDMHDKNGKEIYEGDIVKYGNDMPIEVVFKQEGCFTFKQSELPLGRFQISKMDVVGNIHENPELIPKKEEGHE